ncbi:hypothetical protein ABS768_17035 [Flavobacterium sp. ST-75]|uniref:Uncharacterized protein n=1 Tax=Flavobacterium rhizophilum TaxID=3163296 RepID=A0ABW8YG90_9FLAO
MESAENDIFKKAKQILQDIQGEYFKEKNIDKKIVFEEYRLLRGGDTVHPTWVVCVNEPVFGVSQFLEISDITNEPLIWRTSMVSAFEIKKDTNGKYFIKK